MLHTRLIYIFVFNFLIISNFYGQQMEVDVKKESVSSNIKQTDLRTAGEYHDSGSWKKTLNDKATYFEKNTKERHNIEGTYPSSVRFRPPTNIYSGDQKDAWRSLNATGKLPQGWLIDQGTTGLSNVAHTSSWTGNLITAEAFHVAFLRKKKGENNPEFKAAYQRANEIILGIRKLTLVSGQPGYLARGFAYGHGPSYDERDSGWGHEGSRDLWQQGVGEYKYLRYRGGPSHHNYDQVFRGLGIYYFIAADEAQKKAIKEIVEDMSNWAHLKNNMNVMLENGENISTELIGGWRALDGVTKPSGSSIMATTGLKVAYMITGNKKVESLYNKWVKELGYRDFKDSKESLMGEARKNFDDTDHLLPDLYLLNLIEKDKDLLAFYRKCVKDSWEVHKKDKQSWFNYIYRFVLGEAYSDADGSVWNLQTFPTNRILQPQMNSIRTDIEFYTLDGKKMAKDPLPVYARSSDNEYEWKGSPYALDGWISRKVKALEISPYDDFIQFAIEENGTVYKSFTRGEIWQKIDQLHGTRDLLFFSKYRWLIVVGTNHGIYRSFNGGSSWEKSSELIVDKFYQENKDSNIIYASSPEGIYMSKDFGEWGAAEKWDLISGNTPKMPSKNFTVNIENGRVKMYLQTEQGLYSREDQNSDWNPPNRTERGRGFSGLMTFPGKPLWTKAYGERIFTGIFIDEWAFQGFIVLVSDDKGKTWKPIVKDLEPLYKWMVHAKDGKSIPVENLMRLLEELKGLNIQDIIVDKEDINIWYGTTKTGVAVTHDAGKTWRKSTRGLYIPQVDAIFSSKYANDIYISTPAGVYKSVDKGKTWQDTSLILQDRGALRAEIGGAGYLEAYWLGRYHDFISDEEATIKWWED